MKIPSSLKVGPFTYSVQRVPIVDKYSANTVGQAVHEDRQIKLADHLLPERLESVFIHETLHCVARFMNVDLDEDDVCRLEHGLYMVLKENGLLAEEKE